MGESGKHEVNMTNISDQPVPMDKRQTTDISHTRTGKRKNLWKSLRKTNDIAFGLALFGFILMLFDAEMTFDDYYDEGGIASNCIKSFITISTVFLVYFIVRFHMIDIQLDMLNHNIQKEVGSRERSLLINNWYPGVRRNFQIS